MMNITARGLAPAAQLITLPEGFAATRIPGYFWHCKYRELYSIKTGELKLIKFQKQNRYQDFDGYRVSHLGRRRRLPIEELLPIDPRPFVIPYATA